jgi:hypothetical protein
MKHLAAILAAGCALIASCPAALHWTFHPPYFVPEGEMTGYATTMLGTAEVRCVVPGRWTVSDTHFLPPNVSEADGYVDAVQIPTATAWTPEKTKALHDQLLKQGIPRGATEAAILTEKELEVGIGDKSSYEITYSYNYYGQAYSGAVIYVEHGKLQLQVHFGALKKDFPVYYPVFVGAIQTMNGF